MGFLSGIRFGIGCLCGLIVAIVVGIVLLLIFFGVLRLAFLGGP